MCTVRTFDCLDIKGENHQHSIIHIVQCVDRYNDTALNGLSDHWY